MEIAVACGHDTYDKSDCNTQDQTEIVPFVNELFHVFPSFLKDILLLGIRLKGSGNLFSL